MRDGVKIQPAPPRQDALGRTMPQCWQVVDPAGGIHGTFESKKDALELIQRRRTIGPAFPTYIIAEELHDIDEEPTPLQRRGRPRH